MVTAVVVIPIIKFLYTPTVLHNHLSMPHLQNTDESMTFIERNFSPTYPKLPSPHAPPCPPPRAPAGFPLSVLLKQRRQSTLGPRVVRCWWVRVGCCAKRYKISFMLQTHLKSHCNQRNHSRLYSVHPHPRHHSSPPHPPAGPPSVTLL